MHFYLLLAIILFCQPFTRCYAARHVYSGASLHDRYFHNPYIKIGVQLPIIRKLNGYAYPLFSDVHDKPSFRPFYSISVGNKFQYFNIALEAFYLNLPSKTYMPDSIVSSTRFSAIGGFINASLDVIKLPRNSLFIGAGFGVSKNASHDITWTDSTTPIAFAQRKIKPAFQLFGGIDHRVTQNFAIEGIVKYMDLNKFAVKNAIPDFYQGTFKALTFNINLRYDFGSPRSMRRNSPIRAYPTFTSSELPTNLRVHDNTSYR